MTEQEQEMALSEERSNLAIHVRMCALRHRQLKAELGLVRDAVKAMDGKLEKISAGVWAAVIAIAGMAGSIYATGVVVARGLIGG